MSPPIVFLHLYRCLLLALCLTGLAPGAQPAENRTSVTIWGGLFAPASVRESDRENIKFETYVKPAVNIVDLSQKTWLSAYGLFAVLRDEEKLNYNSKSRFALGIELKHKLTKAIRVSFGARYAWEHEFYSGTNREGTVLTADVSLYRVLRPEWLSSVRAERGKVILSGWANFRYPGSLEVSEKRNFLAQAAIKASLKHPIGGGPFSIAPFTGVVVKADGKRRPWNNTVEPAIGLDLKTPLRKGGELTVGLKTSVQVRYLDGDNESGTIAYMAWYKRF